jgi:hypothetical protein
MSIEQIASQVEWLVEKERRMVQGVALGDIPPETLAQWGQTFEGQTLEVLRKYCEAVVAALAEAERLGLFVTQD